MAKKYMVPQAIVDAFGPDLSKVTDEMVTKQLAQLAEEDEFGEAQLIAAIKACNDNQFRRVKMALGYKVEEIALSVENIPFMTDAEIESQFIAMTKDQRAQFVGELPKGKTVDVDRATKVLRAIAVKTKEAKMQAEKALQTKVESDRVTKLNAERAAEEKNFNEHPELAIKAGRTLTVAQAIKFVYDKPWGQFNTAAELGMMIGENGQIVSQFSGTQMTIADARILGNCFLCLETEAREIVKVAPQPWFKFERHIEVLRERDQTRAVYRGEVEAKFAEAKVPAHVTRVFVQIMRDIEDSEDLGPVKYMKKGETVTASKNRLTEVSQEFEAELRSSYTTLRDKASLSARLDTLQHEIAAAESDNEDERVLKSYGWMVGKMEKQLRWLEAQRNVIHMRPAAGQTEYGDAPVEKGPAGRGRDDFQWAKKLLTARGIDFDPQGDRAKIIKMAEDESKSKGKDNGKKKGGQDEDRRARRK